MSRMICMKKLINNKMVSIQMWKQKSWMLLFAIFTVDEKLTLFILCLIFYSRDF